MPKANAEIIKRIQKCILALENNNIPIKKAVLFGSYATGNFNEWSDIDVALVSDAFIGIRFDDRLKVRDITRKIDIDFSPLTYRPEDFKKSNPFVKEIYNSGILIK